MVYKRYIKVNGKLYGPYEYGSKRKAGKVISEYVGKSERKFGEEIGRSVKKFPIKETFIILSSISIAILLLVFMYNPVLLGNVVMNETDEPAAAVSKGMQDYAIQDWSPGEIDDCGVLSSAGTYTLNKSISISGATCFTITADNVVLDGNGFKITGTEGFDTYGIYSNFMSGAMIKNITVVDFYSGIKFESSVYNSVINNSNFSSNAQHGIHLLAAGGMTLQNLYISKNTESGIRMEGTSTNNKFTNIKSNSNTQYGLDLVDDYSGLVISNSQFNNNLEGIYGQGTGSGFTAKNVSANANTNHGFYFYSTSSSIFNDITTTNSQNGISIDSSSGSLNFLNIISYKNSANNINVPSASSFKYNNSYGEISWTDSNFISSTITISKALTFPGNITISSNFVYLNSEAFDGSNINSSADVTLYNVPVFENPMILRDGFECNYTTIPACVNSTALNVSTVMFNVTSWSNYSIGGSGIAADTNPPTLTIAYPQNTSYNINVTGLNYTASDANLQTCWYSLNSGLVNTTPANCGVNASGLTSSEGNNTWTVWANDSWGYTSFASTTFFKDTVISTIDFGVLTESSGAYLNRNNTVINITVTDANTVNITIRLFNSTGLFNETNKTASTSFVNITNLREGIYYFNATVIDWAGNSNSTATRNVTIDTINPIVNITAPTNITYTTSSVSVAFSLNESGSCLFSINSGGANESMTANSSRTGFSATKSSLSNGNYLMWAYCNDTAGNRNDTINVNFTISVASAPSGSTTGGGGGSSNEVLPVIYVVDDLAFLSGNIYTKSLGVNDKVKYMIDGVNHYVSVLEIGSINVKITIASVPQETTLDIGETNKFEVTGDELYDVEITLNAIENGKADISIRYLQVETSKRVAVALAPVVETISEGIKTSEKAFVFTRPMRIAVEAVVAGIGLIAVILAYFKLIVPAEMAFVFGRPRRRFMKLVNDARKALEKKDYEKARAVYDKMRFDYHTLSLEEQRNMKDEMDEIYAKLK